MQTGSICSLPDSVHGTGTFTATSFVTGNTPYPHHIDTQMHKAPNSLINGYTTSTKNISLPNSIHSKTSKRDNPPHRDPCHNIPTVYSHYNIFDSSKKSFYYIGGNAGNFTSDVKQDYLCAPPEGEDPPN